MNSLIIIGFWMTTIKQYPKKAGRNADGNGSCEVMTTLSGQNNMPVCFLLPSYLSLH